MPSLSLPFSSSSSSSFIPRPSTTRHTAHRTDGRRHGLYLGAPRSGRWASAFASESGSAVRSGSKKEKRRHAVYGALLGTVMRSDTPLAVSDAAAAAAAAGQGGGRLGKENSEYDSSVVEENGAGQDSQGAGRCEGDAGATIACAGASDAMHVEEEGKQRGRGLAASRFSFSTGDTADFRTAPTSTLMGVDVDCARERSSMSSDGRPTSRQKAAPNTARDSPLSNSPAQCESGAEPASPSTTLTADTELTDSSPRPHPSDTTLCSRSSISPTSTILSTPPLRSPSSHLSGTTLNPSSISASSPPPPSMHIYTTTSLPPFAFTNPNDSSSDLSSAGNYDIPPIAPQPQRRRTPELMQSYEETTIQEQRAAPAMYRRVSLWARGSVEEWRRRRPTATTMTTRRRSVQRRGAVWNLRRLFLCGGRCGGGS